MKYLYRIYQLIICLPILVVASILTSLTTVIGCMLGNGHFWGYYPGKLWAQLWIRILLLPVKVEGREHLKKGQSYVFVANHQGAFDIFLIYGFLGRNFKWMVCPLTINGSFDVKPRMKDIYWAFWHPIKLTIHEPIQPIGKGPENIKNQMTKSYDTIMSGLDKEYQGFVENPDQ